MKIARKIKIKKNPDRDVFLIDESCARTIANMQRDIDAYHTAFCNIIGYLMGRFENGRVPTIMCGLAASDFVNDDIDSIVEAAIQLRKDYDNLVSEK